jgi:outer membrane biosynthesis protein TonB
MKLQSLKSPQLWAAVCGIALAFTAVSHANGDGWDKQTTLTVNQPIQITDTYLDPGTYVLRLADIGSSRHVVQIFNADQTHIINTIMAIPNYRLQPTGNSRFAFWETPPGTVQAMRAWFYPGDNFGQEFRYPSHLRQLAVNTPPPPPALGPTPPPAPAVTQTQQTTASAEPAPQPETQSQAVIVQETPANNAPVETAQNTPPANPAPAPAAPQALPKTATPYPLIGLAGLLFLAGYGFIRPVLARNDHSA